MAKSSSEVQLLELKDMISQLNTTIKMLNDTIHRQQKENDDLKAQLAWFRQKMFGSSSERRIDDIEGQLSLFNEMDEFEKPVELIEPETIEISKHTRKKRPTLEDNGTKLRLIKRLLYYSKNSIEVFFSTIFIKQLTSIQKYAAALATDMII